MTLRFYPKSHRYRMDRVPGGAMEPVRGVTGLLSGGIPKPALMNWAPKVVAEYVADNPDEVADLYRSGRSNMVAVLKGIPNRRRDEAGARGTEVHAIGEQIISGAEVDVPDRLLPYVQGYAEFLDRWQIEPVLVEKSVGSRLFWWAGRFDVICRIGRPHPMIARDAVVMLDLKTSNYVYGETAYQTGTYSSAGFYVNDDAPEVELPLPFVEQTFVAHITPDGTDLHPLCDSPDAIDRAYQLFLKAKAIAEADHAAWLGDRLELPAAAEVA